MLSILSCGYVCGNRTTFEQISRRPWLSDVDSQGEIQLATPPQHGFFKLTPSQIAQRLLFELKAEAETACKGFEDSHILMYGGLDSRIVAGVVRQLADEGSISNRIHAVTWGRPGSRDVEIGRAVAKQLGFDWEHVELSPKHIPENIDAVALHLGGMVSPVHLHRMLWLKQLTTGGIVLGGSYGDSVGRAEFSGRNVLELTNYKSNNKFGLLKQECLESADIQLRQDWASFRNRLSDRPEYAKRECEHQAHYMRGLIAQTMSIIDGTCSLYQMFTAPEVVSFVWSIHPSYRDDRPYAKLLSLLGNNLDRYPWARTNRPLDRKVKPIHVESSVNKYHEYKKWIRDTVLPSIDEDSLVNWAEATGIFEPNAVRDLLRSMAGASGIQLRHQTETIVWLMSLHKLETHVRSIGVSLEKCDSATRPVLQKAKAGKNSPTYMRRKIREFPFAVKASRMARKWLLRKKTLRDYPPVAPKKPMH